MTRTRHSRRAVDLLAGRLSAAAAWLGESSDLKRLPLGYFGASTGAAAALVAAADQPLFAPWCPAAVGLTWRAII